jgi:hypothetical protein
VSNLTNVVVILVLQKMIGNQSYQYLNDPDAGSYVRF